MNLGLCKQIRSSLYCNVLKQHIVRKIKIFGCNKKRRNFHSGSLFSTNKAAATYAEKLCLNSNYQEEEIPDHCDVAIIGGGAMGSSIAYWLKQRALDSISVVVIEKDPLYTEASTVLSVGGVRQQFSLEENIKMSFFGANFIQNIQQYLSVEDCDPPDVLFSPNGYLILATDKGAHQLEKNVNLQRKLGAKNELLTPTKLKLKFPWINTDGIVLGCHGLENEGWFDPWCLLCAFKTKARNLGTKYVNGEAVGFSFASDLTTKENENNYPEKLDKVLIKRKTGEIQSLKFSTVVIAAGPQSGEIAKLAKIGTGDGLLGIPLPVEPRKRYVYSFSCREGPVCKTPLTIDPSGVYFRQECLGTYICGRSPLPDEEPRVDNLDVDYDFFNENVWPTLAMRVPAFEAIQVKSGWAGYYEYNTFDANGIIGPHPYLKNLYIATGFSGHGIQQSPAVGHCIMEMILDGKSQTIDVSHLGFERLMNNTPMREQNIF